MILRKWIREWYYLKLIVNYYIMWCDFFKNRGNICIFKWMMLEENGGGWDLSLEMVEIRFLVVDVGDKIVVIVFVLIVLSGVLKLFLYLFIDMEYDINLWENNLVYGIGE